MKIRKTLGPTGPYRSPRRMSTLVGLVTGFAALVALGCSSDAPAARGEGDASTVVDAGADAPGPSSLFSPEAKALLAALGSSVWHGTGSRKGKVRELELQFRGASLQWAETQNPFGPSRRRELRSFVIEKDGIAVTATANTPLTWADRTDQAGLQEYRVVVKPGSPRTLEVTRDGVTEQFAEGPSPKPKAGLTARVRVFPAGTVSDAFCTSGLGGFDYPTFLSFARGKSGTPIAEDVVAGAKLVAWVDSTGLNRFSVSDVDGFKNAGGTTLSDTFNFFVQYTGVITHPGGDVAMRERDDVVEDGVWAFLGPQVGSVNTNDLFLEVHGFAFPDKTPDVPRRALSTGKIPIEIIVARCAKQISPIHVEMALGTGAFDLVGAMPTEPEISDSLFPPAL